MKRAFSLVELSIVLVILGLLVGGVLTGQSLIRAAELRSATTQITQIYTSIYTFRDRFFALPGDMRNATQFWGRADGGSDLSQNCAAPATDSGNGTCNGDGDGNIGFLNTASANYEIYRFWEHLTNAGLLEGSFTGVRGSTPASTGLDSEIGVNIPAGKAGRTGIDLFNYQNTSGSCCYFSDGNSLLLGQQLQSSGSADDPAFTPEEAWNIDTKIDDGQPGTGSFITHKSRNASCSINVTADDSSANYNLQNTSADCLLIYFLE